MQAKKVRDLRPKTGGDVDKTQTIETVARDMKTGKEISRSAATYTTGTPKSRNVSTAPTSRAGGAASPVQRMTDQLASKKYELSNKSGNQKGARVMNTKKATPRG